MPVTKHFTPHTSAACEPPHSTSLASSYSHALIHVISQADGQMEVRISRATEPPRALPMCQRSHLFADGSVKDELSVGYFVPCRALAAAGDSIVVAPPKQRALAEGARSSL